MDVETLRTKYTVSGALCVILYLSRLIGIAPIKFERVHDGWCIRLSRSCSFFGYTKVFILLFFSAFALVADLTINNRVSLTAPKSSGAILWVLDMFVVGIVAIGAAYTGTNRMRYIIHCMAHLKQINMKLSKFNKSLPLKVKNEWLLVIPSLIFGCVVLFSEYVYFQFEIMKQNGHGYTSVFYVFYNLACVILVLLVLQFTLITMAVLKSFQSLNICLRELYQKLYKRKSKLLPTSAYPKPMFLRKQFVSQESKSHNRIANVMTIELNDDLSSLEAMPSELHKLSLLYCSLCDIIRQLDDCHGPVVLLLFLSFLQQLVITPHHIITRIFNVKNNKQFSLMVQCALGVYNVGKVLHILEPCHRTHEQISLTRKLISQIRCCTQSDNFAVISELKMFHRHLMLNEVKYSPMQFFTLNRTVLVGIISSITTYLVVVIQL